MRFLCGLRHETIEGDVFCVRGSCRENTGMGIDLDSCGEGSNTSTVTLRVVGGDKKGSLKSEIVNYGRESQGTRNRERLRWQGPATYTKDRPVLSSETHKLH
jgi:hypothetical protein